VPRSQDGLSGYLRHRGPLSKRWQRFYDAWIELEVDLETPRQVAAASPLVLSPNQFLSPPRPKRRRF
jgi:hypothetical protein